MIEFDLSAEEMEEYAGLYLQGGFSKGTANVSPADYKKLLPLLKHYAKKAHPFRACVRDNRKRFGPLTEKYCAVVKDLIYHSTAWRNKKKAKTMKPALAQDDLPGLDWTEDEYLALAEFVEWVTDERIAEIIADDTGEEGLHLAQLNVAAIRRLESVQDALLEYLKVEDDPNDQFEAKSLLERVFSLIARDKAEAAAGGKITYPTALSMAGQGCVEVILKDDRPVAVEMRLEDGGLLLDEDGVVWKTILREGKWKFSPNDAGAKRPKGLTIVAAGKSDPDNMVISMAELIKNYEDGAIEHVTIPTSHENKVHENTGFIRDLRKSKDGEGRWVLEAAMDFTEPDIKEKAERGSIANTSAGILFDYIRKEDGKKYGAVIEHAALTNKPWLNGMTPFGVAASQEGGGMTVMFSEDANEGIEVEFEDDFTNEELEAIMADEGDGAAAEGGADVELADKKPKKPYGNVTYADPGYQEDGKARYPVDTEKHVRAAWSYINKAKNAAQYSGGQLKKIKSRIRAAMKRIGAQVEMSDEQLTVENEIALRALLAQEGVSATTNSEGGASTVEDKNKQEGEAKTPEEIVAETLGLSVEEVKALQEENARLNAEANDAGLKAKLEKWQEDKKSPALLAEAETILKGEATPKGVSLSEDGKTVELSLAEVVERLVNASPAVTLDQEQVTEKDSSKGQEPKEGDEVELSVEVAAEARRLFLYEGKTEDEAIAAAKVKFENQS